MLADTAMPNYACTVYNSSGKHLSPFYRDKTRPKSWYEADPDELTILPEEGQMEPSLGEKAVDWFNKIRGKQGGKQGGKKGK